MNDFTKNFIKDFIKEYDVELSDRQKDILEILAEDNMLTSQKISPKKPVSMRTILKDLADLQKKGLLRRSGGRRNGFWELLFLPFGVITK